MGTRLNNGSSRDDVTSNCASTKHSNKKQPFRRATHHCAQMWIQTYAISFFFPQLWLNIVEGKVIRIHNRDKSGFACRSVVQFLSDIGLRSLGEEGCDKVASRGCRIRVHLDLEKPRKVRLIAFKPLFDRHPPRWHLGAAGAAHAWTPPPGKGSERRHGFQLMMGGAEQYVSARSMLVLFYTRVK